MGTAAGQIGVSGTSVRYGGVTIGTFVGTTSLVVTLNSAATPARVQALLRSITYSNVSNAPSILERTIKVTLTDGDGGTSNSPTKVVKVTAVNDAPVLSGVSGTASYRVKGKPVVIASSATVADPDSINLSGGKLTVSISKNAQSSDRLGIRNVGNAAWQISVSGTTVRYAGVAIGAFSGTSTLTVSLNIAATPAAVQALLRSITYSNISTTPSILNRTIKFTLTDGDGGISNSPTKILKVVRTTAFASLAPQRSSARSESTDLDLIFADDAILKTILASR